VENYAGFFACLKPVFLIGFLANRQVTLELRTDWIFSNISLYVGLLATKKNGLKTGYKKEKKLRWIFNRSDFFEILSKKLIN
jgi:hypothetical protein